MEMAKIKLNFIDEYVLAVVSGHGRGETNTMRLYESYPSWRQLSGGFTARVSAALDAGHQAADAGSASLTAPLCARACSRSEMPFPSKSASRSSLLVAHDLFRKPVFTFRDHALVTAVEGRFDLGPFVGPELAVPLKAEITRYRPADLGAVVDQCFGPCVI